ncbi:Peptidase C19, ubiquitin carboxyl-terminal hydrolase 2 [Niveomyces insectorum RCEF 264]|uniref:ubiquitinyl hydrolase 1 n=1 Tax=Niveomyces insectorum RCEF 264 TaxID=1081102 RepID=A0A168AHG1_9HYPO|nr:Peptidase C19, ubiquitin carboxyl-terminal hydrolase 2 [Niveomyces insectorum RCEF 264]
MSSHDAWLLTTGDDQHHHNHQHQHQQHYPRTTFYDRTYWDRLAEPSIFVPFLVLLATVAYSANLVDPLVRLLFGVSSALGERLWNAVVTVVPASWLFALDDWLSPFPVPRRPFDRLAPAAARNAKSNALARILGRGCGAVSGGVASNGSGGGGGGGGFFASVSNVGKASLARLMPKGAVDRPAGLGNLSNSCYQNSILQALSALAPLREYLEWIAEEEESGGLPHVQTAQTLGTLVRDLYGSAQNGETLWTPSLLKRMSTFQQQDAQEYFCKLLNEVHDEVEKALRSVQTHPGLSPDDSSMFPLLRKPLSPFSEDHDDDDDNDADNQDTEDNNRGSGGHAEDADDSENSENSENSEKSKDSGYHSSAATPKRAAAAASCFRIPLEGLVAQRIVCQACGYSSGLSMNPFYCLTLNLGISFDEYRLEDTLDSFSAVENIEGVQCANCTLLKFRDRIGIIIGRLEEGAGLDATAMRQKHAVPYERLEAVETALEEEDFEEKTLSDTCKIPDKQRITATKSRQVGIARAPPSIAFHINRSGFDENTGYTFKNPAMVRFPARLDLGPWCLGSSTSVAADASSPAKTTEMTEKLVAIRGDSGKEDGLSDLSESLPELVDDSKLPRSAQEETEQWQMPPQLPMVAGSQQRSRLTGPLYELRAVITHYGQHENGHYVCYRKHPPAREPQHPPEKPPRQKEELAGEDPNRGGPPNLASELTPEDDREAKAAPQASLLLPSGDVETETDKATEGGSVGAGKLPLPPVSEASETSDASDEPPPVDAQWWRLSDQNVSLSDEATVLSQGGVFMLFYDRVDARSVLTPAKNEDAASDGYDHDEKNMFDFYASSKDDATSGSVTSDQVREANWGGGDSATSLSYIGDDAVPLLGEPLLHSASSKTAMFPGLLPEGSYADDPPDLVPDDETGASDS